MEERRKIQKGIDELKSRKRTYNVITKNSQKTNNIVNYNTK